MSLITKTLIATTFGLTTTLAMATPPKVLITHNETNFESNAFVAGTIRSDHPTPAHSEARVAWVAVRSACFGYEKCSAIIKMATDTANPIEVGEVSINLETGVITPSEISGNGFTLTALAPGEVRITDAR